MSTVLDNKVLALSLLEDLLYTNVKNNGKSKSTGGDEEEGADFSGEGNYTAEGADHQGESEGKRVARYKAVLYLPLLCHKMGPQWTQSEVLFFLTRCVQEDDPALTFSVGLCLLSLLLPRPKEECFAAKWNHSNSNSSSSSNRRGAPVERGPYVLMSDAIPLVELLSSQRDSKGRAFVSEVVIPVAVFGMDMCRGGANGSVYDQFAPWDRQYIPDTAHPSTTRTASSSSSAAAAADISSSGDGAVAEQESDIHEEDIKRLIQLFNRDSTRREIEQNYKAFYSFLYTEKDEKRTAAATNETLDGAAYLFPFVDSAATSNFILYSQLELRHDSNSSLVAPVFQSVARRWPLERAKIYGSTLLSDAPLHLSGTGYHMMPRPERSGTSHSSPVAPVDFFSVSLYCKKFFATVQDFLSILPVDTNLEFLIRAQQQPSSPIATSGVTTAGAAAAKRAVQTRDRICLTAYLQKRSALEERNTFLFQLLENLISSRFSGAVAVAVSVVHSLIRTLSLAEQSLSHHAGDTVAAADHHCIEDFTVLESPSTLYFTKCKDEHQLLSKLSNYVEQHKRFHIAACFVAAYARDEDLLEYFSLVSKAKTSAPSEGGGAKLLAVRDTMVSSALQKGVAALKSVLFQRKNSIYVLRTGEGAGTLPVIGPGPVELRVHRHACQDISSIHYNLHHTGAGGGGAGSGNNSNAFFLSNISFFSYYTDRTVLFSILRGLPDLLHGSNVKGLARPPPTAASKFTLPEVIYMYFQFVFPSAFLFDERQYPRPPSAAADGTAAVMHHFLHLMDETFSGGGEASASTSPHTFTKLFGLDDSLASLDYRIAEELLASVELLFLRASSDILYLGGSTTMDIEDGCVRPLYALYFSTILSCALNNNWKCRYLLLQRLDSLSAAFLSVLITINEHWIGEDKRCVFTYMDRFASVHSRLWHYTAEDEAEPMDSSPAQTAFLADLFLDSEPEIRIAAPSSLTKLVSLISFASVRLSLPYYLPVVLGSSGTSALPTPTGVRVLPFEKLITDSESSVVSLLHDLFILLTQSSIRERNFKIRVEAIESFASIYYDTYFFATFLENRTIANIIVANNTNKIEGIRGAIDTFKRHHLHDTLLVPIRSTLMSLIKKSGAGEPAWGGEEVNANVMLRLVIEVTNILLFSTSTPTPPPSAVEDGGGSSNSSRSNSRGRHSSSNHCSFLSLMESLEQLSKNPLWRYRELFALLYTNVLYKFILLKRTDTDGRKLQMLLLDPEERSEGKPAMATGSTDPDRVMEDYLLPLLLNVLLDKAKAVRDSALRYTVDLCLRLRESAPDGAPLSEDFVNDVFWPFLLRERQSDAQGIKRYYLLRMQILDIALGLCIDKKRHFLPLLQELSKDEIANVRLYTAKTIKKILHGNGSPSGGASSHAGRERSITFDSEEKNGVVIGTLKSLLDDSSADVRDEAAEAMQICF